MSIENVKAALPRLAAIGRRVDEPVCLGLEVSVWVNRGDQPAEVEWAVWDGHRHFYATTLDQALALAEQYHGLATGPVPEGVVMPDGEGTP